MIYRDIWEREGLDPKVDPQGLHVFLFAAELGIGVLEALEVDLPNRSCWLVSSGDWLAPCAQRRPEATPIADPSRVGRRFVVRRRAAAQRLAKRAKKSRSPGIRSWFSGRCMLASSLTPWTSLWFTPTCW